MRDETKPHSKKEKALLYAAGQNLQLVKLMREDWSSYRPISPASNRWTIAGQGPAPPGSVLNTTPSINSLRAYPFISPIRRKLINVSIVCSSNTGTDNLRIGIYTDKDDGTLYPNTLLYDGGDMSVSVAGRYVPATAPNLTIDPGKVYWAAMNRANLGVLTAIIGAGSGWVPLLGQEDLFSSANALNCGWLASGQPYGAMPATFPAGAAVWSFNTSAPFISLRWGAA